MRHLSEQIMLLFALTLFAVVLPVCGLQTTPLPSPAPTATPPPTPTSVPTLAPAVFATQFATPLSEVPLLPDAKIVRAEEHRYTYSTQASITEIAEFYTGQMPNLDWVQPPASAYFLVNQLYQAEFEKGNERIIIRAQPENGKNIVAVADVAALSSMSGNLETYFPHRENTVWWYFVSPVGTDEVVDYTSFTIVGTDTLDDGTKVYLVENVYGGGQGISTEYQEITSEHVRIRGILNKLASGEVVYSPFTPPLPILRFPLEVGRSWSEEVSTHDIMSTYSYQVEALVAVSVPAGDFQGCFRVVRTKDGTADYKSEYCPDVGGATFEILTANGQWLRAELTGMTTSRLALKGLRLNNSQCQYIFDGIGFSPEEMLTFVIPDLAEKEVDTPEGLGVPISLEAPSGNWIMATLKGSENLALSTFQWAGECRAAFFDPPPSLEPSLILIGQEANDWGGISNLMVGIGWQAGETLTFTAEGLASPTQTATLQVNELGSTRLIQIPLVQNPADGDYIFTLEGETQTAMLIISCGNGFCQVKDTGDR
jgi:hypothetical protein